MADQQRYRGQVEGWLNDRRLAGEEWTQFSDMQSFLNQDLYRKTAFNDLYVRGNIEAEEREDGIYVRWTSDEVENDDITEHKLGLKGSRDYMDVNHESMPMLHVDEVEEHFRDKDGEYDIEVVEGDDWNGLFAEWSSKSGHMTHEFYVTNDDHKQEEEVRAYVNWKIPEWAEERELLFPERKRENYIKTVAEDRFQKLTERNIGESLRDLADAQLQD
jgi:hypothetical protein